MPILRQLFFFSAIYFLLCPIISIMIGTMNLGYAGFQTIYHSFGNYALIFPPLGFLLICFLIRSYAPQSRGSGYYDLLDLLKKTTTNKSTLKGEKVPDISHRDLIARFFLTPLCALFGGSVGQTGPELHMSCAYALLFEKKIKLPREVLIYAAFISVVTILFHSPIAGFIFALESAYIHRKITSLNSTNRGFFHSFSFISRFFLALPFLVLASFISIFWLQIIGSWDYSFPTMGFNFLFLHTLDWVNFLYILIASSLMVLTFQLIYRFCSIWMDDYWLWLSLFWGLMVSLLIYSFGSSLSGSGMEFLNPDHGFDTKYWQKWLANLATLSSGVSSGLISTSLGIGALLSESYFIDYSIGISVFFAMIIKRPLTAAFLVSELMSFALFPALFGAIASYFFLNFFSQLIKKMFKIFKAQYKRS